MIEGRETRIRRLRMRSIRRGIKEMDLILTRFSDSGLEKMSNADLDIYDAMLEQNDHDLYAWVTGKSEAPEPLAPMVARIARSL